MDFKKCLAFAEQRGALKRLGGAGPVYEASRLARENLPSATLFEYESGPTLACGVASREGLAEALGAPLDLLHARVAGALKVQPPPLSRGEPSFEAAPGGFDRLPVLTYFEGDGGPFITGGIFFIEDPSTGPNASWHRMMVTGPRRASVRAVEGRGLHDALLKSGGKLRAAVCLGTPVQVMVAAAMPLAPGEDELAAANALAPVAVAEVGGFQVPASSEIVLLGRFTAEQADEGPFVDITGTRDFVRKQPVFELERLYLSKDPVYHAVVPASPEHRFLMGFPRETAIFSAVSKLCPTSAVRLTEGGCGWLHAVIAIRRAPGFDPAEAGRAAFGAHQSLKHAVIVDDDIDPSDPEQVEWAVATRLQADRDLTVLPDEPSSSLDPSARHEAGKRSRTAKTILDATKKPRGGPYERVF